MIAKNNLQLFLDLHVYYKWNILFLLEADKLFDAINVNVIRRCKNNDAEAYNRLIGHYEAYIYQICYNYSRNKEEALDLVQEVYIKIFRGINSFDERRPFLPWLKKITINTLINESRKKQLEKTTLHLDTLIDQTNLEEQVVLNDTRDTLNRFIAELPENYRLSLTMRYHESMSYEEIANALEQPLGTVKSNVHRARNLIRQKMQACDLLEV